MKTERSSENKHKLTKDLEYEKNLALREISDTDSDFEDKL